VHLHDYIIAFLRIKNACIRSIKTVYCMYLHASMVYMLDKCRRIVRCPKFAYFIMHLTSMFCKRHAIQNNGKIIHFHIVALCKFYRHMQNLRLMFKSILKSKYVIVIFKNSYLEFTRCMF
jgi:hypothetical protein